MPGWPTKRLTVTAVNWSSACCLVWVWKAPSVLPVKWRPSSRAQTPPSMPSAPKPKPTASGPKKRWTRSRTFRRLPVPPALLHVTSPNPAVWKSRASPSRPTSPSRKLRCRKPTAFPKRHVWPTRKPHVCAACPRKKKRRKPKKSERWPKSWPSCAACTACPPPQARAPRPSALLQSSRR